MANNPAKALFEQLQTQAASVAAEVSQDRLEKLLELSKLLREYIASNSETRKHYWHHMNLMTKALEDGTLASVMCMMDWGECSRKMHDILCQQEIAIAKKMQEFF